MARSGAILQPRPDDPTTNTSRRIPTRDFSDHAITRRIDRSTVSRALPPGYRTDLEPSANLPRICNTTNTHAHYYLYLSSYTSVAVDLARSCETTDLRRCTVQVLAR